MKLKKILCCGIRLKKAYKLIEFRKKSFLGKKFECSEDANCINKSGEKTKIIIGDNCTICGTLYVSIRGKIQIGDYTTIRYDSKITCSNSIKIGNYVIISNNVTIADNNSHPISSKIRKEMCMSGFESKLWDIDYAESKPVIIEDNVWIGENVTILKGVTIGKGSIIGTQAVVTKNIPPYTIAAGNPAKIVKMIG